MNIDLPLSGEPRMAPPWSGGGPRRTASSAPRDALREVRLGYCGLVTLAGLFQFAFFWRYPDNAASTAIALISSVIGIGYALNGARFRAQPVSALILLLYSTTATAGALLVKSLEGTALADRLQVPLKTFLVLSATQMVLLVADYIYFHAMPLRAVRRFIGVRLLQRCGLMSWPSDWQLWALGLLGCASVMLTGTDYESGVSFGMAGAAGKALRAFGFLKFAPFLIPFRDALCGFPARTRRPIAKLGLYFVMLVGISFATNSRSTFGDAVPTIGLCALIAQGLGRIDFRRIPVSRIVLFVLVAGLSSLLLSRVALAMVVVRDYRYSVDVQTLIRMTVEVLFNSEWLESAKSHMDSSTYVGDYSETYVDSTFLARFLLTKFHDNIIYYTGLFGPDHIHGYREFMFDRFAATLPDPLLHLFGINIDKQDLVVSNGDYIIYMIDGWGLGGFKTGSMIGEVFGVFGWAFPLVIVGSALLLFVFYDAFVVPTAYGRLAFSPLILLLIWNLVGTTAAFGLGAETVTAIPSGIARGLPQDIVAYLIAVTAVKLLGRMIGRR